jgi:protein SCO1
MSDSPDLRWYQNPWIWGVIFGLLFIPLIRPLTRNVPDPPPVMGELPTFSLVDQEGEAFGTEQMAGDVWVVGFFFTSCRSVCPRITAAMGSLQEKYVTFGHDVRLLTISVDPTVDTPDVLAAKAAEVGAEPGVWSFITGEEAKVRDLVQGGFKTGVGERIVEEATGMIDIAHTERLVLVDWQGRIRGYYSIDELGLDEVYHRSRHVLREKKELDRAAARQSSFTPSITLSGPEGRLLTSFMALIGSARSRPGTAEKPFKTRL